MIPKVIHYIWLGGNPLPKIAQKCMESWKKFCPDWEIKRWDETNLDLNKYLYAKQAYDAKKFAFASDVFRFDILHSEGGVYLDIDVEIIKPIDEFLKNKAFFAMENGSSINPGLIAGSEPNLKEFKEILDLYSKKSFLKKNGKPDLTTICLITTEFFKSKGFKTGEDKIQTINGIKIYPKEYFCPIQSIDKKINLSENTHTIHHYLSSWAQKPSAFLKFRLAIRGFIKKLIGKKNVDKLRERKNRKKWDNFKKDLNKK